MKARWADRPRLSLPPTKTEILIEVFTLPLQVMNFVMLATYWQSIPAVIPSHFDLQGNVNATAPKEVLITLCLLGLLSYTLCTVLSLFPHTFNYMTKITEVNAKRQYLLARKFLGVVKLETSAIMTFALWSMIEVALKQSTCIDVGGLMTLLVMLILSSCLYMFLASRQ